MDNHYIAGFFDGEGNINKVKVKGRIYFQIRLYQGGERGRKLLEEIKSYLNMGYVGEKKRLGFESVWELRITKREDILRFAEQIGKLCIIKDFSIIKTE